MVTCTTSSTSGRFQAAVEAIPEEMRVYWRYHRVENGETLSEIARRYHTTATAIAEANNLEGTALVNDSKLIIPVSPAAKLAPSRPVTAGYSKHPMRYTVHKGDTVLSVADDFGVPAEKVRQWNRLQGNALHAGRSLTIFKSAAGPAEVQAASATTDRRHTGTREAEEPPRHRAHPSAKPAGKRTLSGSRRAVRAPAAKHLKAISRTGTASSRSKRRKQQD